MSDCLKKYLAIILATQMSLGQLAMAVPAVGVNASAYEKSDATSHSESEVTDPTVVKVSSNPENPNASGSVEFEQITVTANATAEMLENVASHIKNRLAEIDSDLKDGYHLEVLSLSPAKVGSPIEVSTALDTTTFDIAPSENGTLNITADVSAAHPSPQTAVHKVLQDAISDQNAELKKIKVPLDEKISNFLGTTKRNLYFTIITAVGGGAIAAGLEHQNIVQLIGSEGGISPAWSILTGLGVGGFEGAIQLKIKWYSDWISDKAFNPYRLTGDKNSGASGMANTWLKRFVVCLAFVGMVNSIGAITGTQPGFEASLSYWQEFLTRTLKDSGVYITSTLPLMEYLKAVGPKKGFDSDRRQLAVMEAVNFSITQGANAAILLGRLPSSLNIPLPELLQFNGATDISSSALVSVGMLVAGSVLWIKQTSVGSIWQKIKNQAAYVRDGIASTCSSIFK